MEKINKNNSENREEAKTMKAIGYASGMYVDNEGNVVDRGEQKKRIEAYAEANGIEIVAMYEDVDECEKVMDRPGIKKMLEEANEAEVALVECVWSLGRTRAVVSPFMKALDSKGLKLEAATTCFDVTSQFTRFWYGKSGSQTYAATRKAIDVEKPVGVKK